MSDDDRDVLVETQRGKHLLRSVPYYLTACAFCLVGVLVALICGLTCQRHSDRLVTCCFYKFYPDRSVIFEAPVTGLLQSLKCKENKCSESFILLNLWRNAVELH